MSEELVSIVSIVTTALLAILSIALSKRQQRQQQQREDELRTEQRQREDQLREKRRENKPRIEFDIECQVHGLEAGECLIELTLTTRNRGMIEWRFKSILLRIRGSSRGQPFDYWKDGEHRLKFPIALIDDAEIVPKGLNYLFVEPGIEQRITYVTKLPVTVGYILIHVEFKYDEHTPHTSERVFHLPPSS